MVLFIERLLILWRLVNLGEREMGEGETGRGHSMHVDTFWTELVVVSTTGLHNHFCSPTQCSTLVQQQ